ncbi:MAG: NAD-dependent epimerase/dehydratase family protein [Spirochaetales bacterium]|nr:MAG: NAD-dependent epimerase/dehydratase family protein [Spirochaetales bacterium]
MDTVTGSFGYIGKYLTAALLEKGREVRTITTHPDKPNPFGAAVRAFPYSFDDPLRLTETLSGTDTLYNTYWIRFPYGGQTYETALENTRVLFQCAKKAGVKRIVHIGVTQASIDSSLPYYRGKALQEIMLSEAGIPFSVVRPTLVFGREDILVNNIAWLIRTFPVFPIFGSGSYRVQPVFVGDLAAIAVQSSKGLSGVTIDAPGPESFTFEQMVRLIARKLERKTKFIKVPPALGILGGKIISLFVGDVMLTENELAGLMAGLLTSTEAPKASVRFPDWLEENINFVGTRYTSEIARHFRWSAS